MPEIMQLGRAEVQEGLRDQDLRTTQIIHIATVAGPVLFLAVVIFLRSMPGALGGAGGGAEMGPDLGLTLLPITGVIALAAIVAAVVVPNLMLKPQVLAKRLEAASSPVSTMVALHRTLDIIRLAILEGAALFGLVVLLLSVMGGYLDDNPVFWVGLAPLGILVLVGLVTFPSRTYLTSFILDKMLQPARRHLGA